MSITKKQNSQITIVVVPRERFCFARESLESLYENTEFPFNLVYVDNKSPAKLRRYLETEAELKGFKLVQSDYYLSPNQARNLGLREVNSKYVVFVDNDVIFSPGWLKALVDCAEETEATVVGSLVCQHMPLHEIIHCAGGEYLSPEEFARFASNQSSILPENSDSKDKLNINEKNYRQGQRLSEMRDQLKRQPTGYVEFHSVLVDTEVFKEIGVLDEGYSCTKEYLDFCMSVTKAGGTIYLEPSSIVTFLTHPPAPPLEWSDIPYFMLRWSDAWELASLQHFQNKWNLAENEYFTRRYKKLGWRRYKEIVKPLSLRLTFGHDYKPLTKFLKRWEKKFNRYLGDRYAKQQKKRNQPLSNTQIFQSESINLLSQN